MPRRSSNVVRGSVHGGGSYTLTLPKDIVRRLGLKGGELWRVSLLEDGSVVYRPLSLDEESGTELEEAIALLKRGKGAPSS